MTDMTQDYLYRLQQGFVGVMLAVCTSDYGEMTDSPCCPYSETGQRIQCSLDVLPLQVEDNWKHNPPCGEGRRTTQICMKFYSCGFYWKYYKDRLPQQAGRRNRPRDSDRLAQTCVDQPNLSGRKRMSA